MSIISAMQRRYGSDAYVLMFEVGNSTGFACNRHADALAVGLWPSKGIEIIGFEFKESRSDWLRELKEPAKAESIYRYCHRWYLVVSDAAILKHGELPKTWGQLTLQKDGKLKESVKAPKLEPAPITMEFLAAMMRSAAKPSEKAARVLKQEEYQRGYDNGKRSAVSNSPDGELESLREQVRKFEEASGVKIAGRWDIKDIGKAVKRVMKMDDVAARSVQDLEYMKRSATSLLSTITKTIESVREVTA